MDGYLDKCMYLQMDVWTDRQMNGQRYRMDRWKDKWVNGCKADR